MPYTTGAAPVYYRHWTADTPRSAVFLLHGFGEHTGHYQRLAAELTRRGHDVWAPDHKGHGLTGPRDGQFRSVDQLADAARSVIDIARASTPVVPWFLLGHSLGGLVAASIAARDPHQFACLVMTGAPIAGRGGFVPGAQAVFSMDTSYTDDLAFDPLAFDTESAEANLWDRIDEFLAAHPTLQRDLTMPVLMVSGERDLFTSPDRTREWAAGVADSRYIEVPGGFHDIVNDTRHRFVAQQICDFLDGVALPHEERAVGGCRASSRAGGTAEAPVGIASRTTR